MSKELQDRIAALEAANAAQATQLTAANKALEDANTALKEFSNKQRSEAVATLAKDLGLTFDEATTKVYTEMPEQMFSATAATMRSLKAATPAPTQPKKDAAPALFSHTAKNGTDERQDGSGEGTRPSLIDAAKQKAEQFSRTQQTH